MTAPEEDGPDMTAGELALGVLEGEERTAALRRVLSDPYFAREVERWRTYFASLLDEVPDVVPSAAVGRRIEESVAATPRVGVWRAATAAMTLIAATLLAVLILRPQPAPPAPAPAVRSEPLIAALAPGGKGVTVAAAYDAATREVRLSPLSDAPAAHAAELWTIGKDGVPHSLGLLSARDPSRIVIAESAAARLAPGVALAISIEPPGGSPTGLPTGPVVASGKLLTI